jgi:3-phenylpropionate/trans-cinnamate dioxygenase ferredoxin reductase subunit
VPSPIVVVGGGLAALRVAEALRRHGSAGLIQLISSELHLPYDRPPLSKAVLRQGRQHPPYLCSAEALEELEIELRTGAEAVRIDTAARTVHLADGTLIPFGQLVIATGLRARPLALLSSLPSVHVLRTWEDAVAVEGSLTSASHVTVVGAGVLGCEVAASARQRGLEVSLLEGGPYPMSRMTPPEVGSLIEAMHRVSGVEVRCDIEVKAVQTDVDGRLRLDLTSGSPVHTDALVVCIGAVPNTEWLEGSGVAVDDGVLCDAMGATTVPDVWAVGDVARMPHRGHPGRHRLEHWTNATDTASLVAQNMLAEPAERRTFDALAYFWSDQNDTKIQGLGMPLPTDEFTVVDGQLGDRFLGLWHRNGSVTGALAWECARGLDPLPEAGRRRGRAGDPASRGPVEATRQGPEGELIPRCRVVAPARTPSTVGDWK